MVETIKKIAIEQLEKQENLIIRPSGLFIDKEISFLGATPDGLIAENGIVEIKCPYNSKKQSLMVNCHIFKKTKKQSKLISTKITTTTTKSKGSFILLIKSSAYLLYGLL